MLREKYGFYIYSTDDSRNCHWQETDSINQLYMSRDFQKEYGVKSFWELPKEVIWEREAHFVQEMTPMIIADLIALSAKYPIIICEGDIDYRAVIPVAAHMVYLCNRGTKFDWFKRSNHEDLVATLSKRSDLSKQEKQTIIENAYACIYKNEEVVPEWVECLKAKTISWDAYKSDGTLKDFIDLIERNIL